MKLLIFHFFLLVGVCLGQESRVINNRQVNGRPRLIRGNDLNGFSLFENTPVGSKIYTLRGEDPEGSRLSYFISGDYLSVDSNTGVVTLAEALDRELVDNFDVVVTIQDESIREEQENLVTIRRSIRVLDKNDNPPEFRGKPYVFSVPETETVGQTLYTGVNIIDADTGRNAEITLRCTEQSSTDACDTFDVFAERLEDGKYIGLVILKKGLDYERLSSYNLDIEAVDQAEGGEDRLAARASIIVEVEDVQDQAPVFLNSPYSATVPEATRPNQQIFSLKVRDGDTGKPRDLDVSIEGDSLQYFKLVDEGTDNKGVKSLSLQTTENQIDREDKTILDEGGLYTFKIVARELVGPGDTPSETSTGVTIVVTDIDDELPVFSRSESSVPVPEDVGADTPLPGLNLEVEDRDVSNNAAFTLSLQSVSGNADGVFYVYPERAIGKTPVIIRVRDPDRLDHENPDAKEFELLVVAETPSGAKVSSRINVVVTDSNDNVPEFAEPGFEFSVGEDADPGTPVGTIQAADPDTGSYGEVVYAIRGFGSEKFSVEPTTGLITVAACGRRGTACLDYETQKTFSLIYTATDGGGQITTTSLVINIEDVNDNHPEFEQAEYRRVVREGDTKFEPPLVIKAVDRDGPLQGGGKVFYSRKSINTDAVVFDLDPITGELTIIRPVSSEDTENGRYDLVIRATDQGRPDPLHADINVFINVGTSRNQKPSFLREGYQADLQENARPGDVVATVEAEDPDGSDADLRYSIYSGSKDNFVINAVTGEVSVAEEANLDIEANGDLYEVEIHVLDNGEPHKQTGGTLLTINIQDVNNKAPRFSSESYTEYVVENEPTGYQVLSVLATDPDRSADLEYDIVEPIVARDKSGTELDTVVGYNFKAAFSIDPRNGRVVINEKLDYNSAAVIILTLQVKDKNAEIGKQVATAEATFYIQSFNADSPVFPAPWTPSDPTFTIQVDEELPPGTPLFNLTAKDPLTGLQVNSYQKLEAEDPFTQLIQVSQYGAVISNQRLDYEQIKEIKFSVAALAGDLETRRSDAHITLKLRDVNDNAPVFERPVYRAVISEDARPGLVVHTVQAMDADTGPFGQVVYSIEGEGTDQFSIHPTKGYIQVKEGTQGRATNLDREEKEIYSLRVVARDIPEGGPDQKSTSAVVEVTLTDVNDSPPSFSQTRYTAVVPENSPLNTLVAQVSATDPDVGQNSEIMFKFYDPKKVKDYRIDPVSGKVYTNATLTGKGRREPYVVEIRAMDKGVKSKSSDTKLYITIGDVSANDGVPRFLQPEVGVTAMVREEAPVGTFVYQVVAEDPDDDRTANGKLVYSFPDDGSIIHQLFSIHPSNGRISTIAALDREMRSQYSLTIKVRDLGTPVQQTTRTLEVQVQDIDDHPPQFARQRNSVPLRMEVLEEVDLGRTIGTVQAVDEDEGPNAEIDYAIIGGDKAEIFTIVRQEDNTGDIVVRKRLDREEEGVYTLTIRCFKYGTRGLAAPKPYDKTQLNEVQVKIVVLDQDDNNPVFSKKNETLGVRVNAPLYTELTTVSAVDPDADANPVRYSIEGITFHAGGRAEPRGMEPGTFIVDAATGLVQTNRTYNKYNEGYFDLSIKAANDDLDEASKADYTYLRIFVLQDTDLMKFVFDEDPLEVSKHLPEIKSDLEAALALPLSINIYDTEFYSKYDGSLDFGRTSSCFQVLNGSDVINFNTVESLFKTDRNSELQRKLDQYRVINIERCAHVRSAYKMSWVEICILGIGILIGLVAFIAAVSICCLYAKYKRRLRRNNIRIVEAPVRALIPASLPPGSVIGHPPAPSVAGSNGRIYEWQETALPIDTASYKSMPR